MIPELDEQVSMFDVDKISMVTERGAEATRKQLPHIRRALKALG